MPGKHSWTTRCANQGRVVPAPICLLVFLLICLLCCGGARAAGNPAVRLDPAAVSLPDHLGQPPAAWASRSRALMGSAVNWRVRNGLELWTPSVLAVPGTHATLDGRIYLRLKGHRSMLGVSYAF